MKAFITLITILGLISVSAPQSKADEEGALIGGIIGGLILGEILDGDNHHRSTQVSYGHRSSHGHHHGGYYKWVSVKTWIPGGYHFEYDDCGNRYRVYYRGHYDYHKKKVWVPARSHHYKYRNQSRDRHDDKKSHRNNRHNRSESYCRVR